MGGCSSLYGLMNLEGCSRTSKGVEVLALKLNEFIVRLRPFDGSVSQWLEIKSPL